MNAYQYVLLGFAVVLGFCGVALAGMAIWRDEPRLAVGSVAAWLLCFSIILRLAGEDL
jgi:hypothetical protein